MFRSDQYQLLDFGNGRRLETFGPVRLDRPCPVANDVAPADADAWPLADARFHRGDGQKGQWVQNRELPKCWTLSHDAITLELKRTEFGHVGLFPEQATNWDWVARRLQADRPLEVLNLFAYTGGSTLASAAAGAKVVHLDAAKNLLAWARRNAELSGLNDAPIRWIADDVNKFVHRELKRENRYDAVILDPPSYGHGLRGEQWQLTKHLPRLLSMCNELTVGRRRFILLTCHTPSYDTDRLRSMMQEAFGPGHITAKNLTIRAATGRHLQSGVVARWEPIGS